MNKLTLITGGAGFIGSHVTDQFQRAGRDLSILDDLSTGDRRNLKGIPHRFVEGCVTDREKVQSAIAGAECVIHLAAISNVPESFLDESRCNKINVLGLQTLLEAAVAGGIKKFIFASSASVYGAGEIHEETTHLMPQSPYAASKVEGERLLEFFHREHGLETVTLRFFNVFGPRQGANSSAVIPSFVRRALRNEDIIIHGNGEQLRDFIYTDDIVSALALATVTPGMAGVYNAGSGIPVSINALASKILDQTGSSSRLVYVRARQGDVKNSHADTTKLRGMGWKPLHTLDEALATTIDFYGGTGKRFVH